MWVSSIILGRPWFYDNDAILHGWYNTCVFTFYGKKITINPTPPQESTKRGYSLLKEKKVGLNFITVKELEKEISEGTTIWMLAVKEVSDPIDKEYPQEVKEVLSEFSDMFLEDLPDQLPPLRDV